MSNRQTVSRDFEGFNKVLIANRGEIALRVLRALRKLKVATVMVYHEADQDSPAVQQADEAIEIFGDSPTAAYLDMQQLLEVCQRVGADAVHPCYGFLAENANFARLLTDAGVCFIGPQPEVIELMGDKIRSRQFVMAQGYPVPPSVEMDADDPKFIAAVSEMTFPLVVKASAGGGGKGMSIVRSPDELEGMLKIAASEAQKYFGDKRVYVERYFEKARHIEVQVLGAGESVIHLWERECSVQRRFQKIIEESPSPALSDESRRDICEIAAGIARAANYSNAGTVEFLYTQEGECFFLEMNTRIQVEHPVTEMVTGIDLVEQQIRVAAGEKLSIAQSDVQQRGHAIECRICAEDAFDNFLPETGKVLFLREPASGGFNHRSRNGVRVDSGLYTHQAVTTAFDPMLSKLIVHAPTRSEAIAKAIGQLREYVLLGVNTNMDYLGQVLAHPAFVEGVMDTGFLERHSDELVKEELSEEQWQALMSTALLSDHQLQTIMAKTPELHAIMGNWRN